MVVMCENLFRDGIVWQVVETKFLQRFACGADFLSVGGLPYARFNDEQFGFHSAAAFRYMGQS